MLPGNVKNKHMSIMFRRAGKWSDDELEALSKETDRWIRDKYGSNKAPVTFTIDRWGAQSCHIFGDLQLLCLHLIEKFGSMSLDKQRVPHVALFKTTKHSKH